MKGGERLYLVSIAIQSWSDQILLLSIPTAQNNASCWSPTKKNNKKKRITREIGVRHRMGKEELQLKGCFVSSTASFSFCYMVEVQKTYGVFNSSPSPLATSIRALLPELGSTAPKTHASLWLPWEKNIYNTVRWDWWRMKRIKITSTREKESASKKKKKKGT